MTMNLASRVLIDEVATLDGQVAQLLEQLGAEHELLRQRCRRWEGEVRGVCARHEKPLPRSLEIAALADLQPANVSLCVVCHEDLKGGQRLVATNCGHVFCAGCISRALAHKDQCPTCRKAQPAVTALYF